MLSLTTFISLVSAGPDACYNISDLLSAVPKLQAPLPTVTDSQNTQFGLQLARFSAMATARPTAVGDPYLFLNQLAQHVPCLANATNLDLKPLTSLPSS